MTEMNEFGKNFGQNSLSSVKRKPPNGRSLRLSAPNRQELRLNALPPNGQASRQNAPESNSNSRESNRNRLPLNKPKTGRCPQRSILPQKKPDGQRQMPNANGKLTGELPRNGQNAQGKRQNISLPKRPGEPDSLLLNSRNLKSSPQLRSRSKHSSLPAGMPPSPKREKLKREPCAKCRKKPRQNKLPRRINLLKFGVPRKWLPKSPNGSEKK